MKELGNSDICKPEDFVERNTDTATAQLPSGRLITPPHFFSPRFGLGTPFVGYYGHEDASPGRGGAVPCFSASSLKTPCPLL